MEMETTMEVLKLAVRGIPSEHADALRSGGLDANSQAALSRVAEGQGNPCRHCLQLIAPGDTMLVLSYRPFARPQPYAEQGPIFLHGKTCEPYDSEALPAWFGHLQPALLRGYGADDWIRYETAQVIPGQQLDEACRQILADDSVAYVHIRSKYNCFQCRVERG
jgi:hypothetical protein